MLPRLFLAALLVAICGSGGAEASAGLHVQHASPSAALLQLRGGTFLSPPELYSNAVFYGEKKASMPASKIFKLAIISGAHVALGGALAVQVGGNMPLIASQNPGLQKILFGIFGLPLGLYLVLGAGGELFTGNTALVTAALIEGKATLKQLAKSWASSYAGNFIGCLALAKFMISAEMLPLDALGSIATAKVSKSFAMAFMRGVFCNWLVCLAVWMSIGCDTLTEKATAALMLIPAFVALGGEHSVANMLIIPSAIFGGKTKITWADFLLKNLLPVTMGNILGGAICQTAAYSSAYGSLGREKK